MQKFRKNTLLELVKWLDDGNVLVKNEGDPSDQLVIPRDTFNSTYDEVTE